MYLPYSRVPSRWKEGAKKLAIAHPFAFSESNFATNFFPLLLSHFSPSFLSLQDDLFYMNIC